MSGGSSHKPYDKKVLNCNLEYRRGSAPGPRIYEGAVTPLGVTGGVNGVAILPPASLMLSHPPHKCGGARVGAKPQLPYNYNLYIC